MSHVSTGITTDYSNDDPARFSVSFITSGAAFYAHNYGDEDHEANAAARDPYEVAEALKSLAERVEQGATYGHVIDTNGNKIGDWFWE